MICQWCKKSFPHRTGRFCGTCQDPKRKETIEDVRLELLGVRGLLVKISAHVERIPTYYCTTTPCSCWYCELKALVANTALRGDCPGKAK